MNGLEPDLVEIEKHYHKRKYLVNDKLPEDLPVEIVERDLPEDEQICPECGSALHVMGREAHRELKLVPAQSSIVDYVRKVYACRNCEKNKCGVPVVKAPVHEPVIKGSLAGRYYYCWVLGTRPA